MTSFPEHLVNIAFYEIRIQFVCVFFTHTKVEIGGENNRFKD